MTFSPIHQQDILKHLGFEHLNKMQQATLDTSTQNANLLLLAPTGSGKTAAYLLSMLPKIKDQPGVQALILAPTRELVLQIESVLKQMKLPFKTNACYGGHKFSIERQNFSTPPTILVGTPGRIKDHLERKTFDPKSITQLIFDEFDKSLEFGFSLQMEYIFKQLPNVTGQILVSATQSIEIPNYLNIQNPRIVNFTQTQETKGELSLRQHIVSKDDKPAGLLKVLNQLQDGQNAIVFVNHRAACDRISEHLDHHETVYSIFHGGLKQEKRELELTKFRNGSTQVLIATDIAARGIDIPELDYVIHYQMPHKENSYIHRNGRTARMKAAGTSILIRTLDEKLPLYIAHEPMSMELQKGQKIAQPQWVTLYIGKGKKDKISKFDLVGFFLQFDFMEKSDLGLIEVKDYSAYIAIKKSKSNTLLKAAPKRKIKNKKVKIALAL